MDRSSTTATDSSASLQSLIEAFNGGNRQAEELLIQRLYRELRQIAAGKLRHERGNHTLQPTALVHEAYARLNGQSELHLKSRAHLLGVASNLMRQILVDHARTRLAAKRGGCNQQVSLDERVLTGQDRPIEIVALDEALCRLAQLDPRHASVVEMHFFGGLTFQEIAEVLNIGIRTAKQDWAMARAWLRRELSANK